MNAQRSCSTLFPLFLLASPATIALGQATSSSEEIKILSLEKQVGDDFAIVVIVIQRPDDMGAQATELSRWQRRNLAWPRVAELRTIPATTFVCYQELDFPIRNAAPRRDRLTFIGRCQPTDALDVVFRYPLENGSWKRTELTLDLKQAGAIPTQAEPSPQRRWGRAQAKWFGLLGQTTGDVGGFFTFAEQQTVRKFEIQDYGREETARRRRFNRLPDEQLYNITTGALAVQESLQLDRMTNTDRDRGERTIRIQDIAAVGIKSHPFDKMRGEAEPRHSELARLVPEDHYYARFASVGKLLDLLDFAERWGGSLMRLAQPIGTDYGTRARALEQLCLSDDVLTRMLGPAVVHELALSGSDPYLRDGSDITLLFRVKQKEVFTVALGALFSSAESTHPDATRDQRVYDEIAIESLVDANRNVSCYRFWLDDVCVYSNSLVAAKRIIDTGAERLASLAADPGFRYMRAVVYPHDETREDGFVFLSDPFIRRLVGPDLRIKQKRRLEAVTSLKMLTNAAMFYGYQHGPSRPTLEQLIADRSLNADDLYDPEGGSFTWDAEAGVARSTTYGDLRFQTPLIEIEADYASAKEKEQYDQFRDRYQEYWRTFFDPIGVRIGVGKTLRLETCILPLIDSSTYERFEDIAGGEPIEVRLDRFTPNTLLRFVMHLNDGASKIQALAMLNMLTRSNAASDWVGQWLTFWVEDTDAFTTLIRREYENAAAGRRRSNPQEILDVFNASIVFGVHAKNKVSLAAFLISVRAMIETTAPDTVVFNALPAHKGTTIVQIAPDPSGPIAEYVEVDESEPVSPETTQPVVRERAPAIYYATIGDGFYVSTQASALRSLIDLHAAGETTPAKKQAVKSNLLIYAAPAAAELVRPAVSYFMEQRAREVSLGNLGQVWLLGRCGLLEQRSLEEVAPSFLGYRLVCPNGGSYHYAAAAADASSSIYGPLSEPKRLSRPPEGSPLTALLDSLDELLAHARFTEEGLTTTVEIRRR